MDIRQICAEQTWEIRQRVMWPNRSVEEMRIDGEGAAFHFGVFQNDGLIGVASFFPDGARIRLRKLAVEPAHQKQGVARDLVMTAMDELAQQNFELIWCHARLSAIGFYRSLGFCEEGDVFQKNGLDYVIASRSVIAAGPGD